MNTDLDGTWNRMLTLDTIRVCGVRDGGGSGVTDWLVDGPLRVLEMRDPNSGMGSDATTKPRFQYVATAAGILKRCLPPEGRDAWQGDAGPPPFVPADPSEYIRGLLAS